MGVPRGRYGIGVEIGRVSVAGVGGAVCRGDGVSIHHHVSCLVCVHAGRGRGGGGRPSESSTPISAAGPSSRGLLCALRSGPACGSAAGDQERV